MSDDHSEQPFTGLSAIVGPARVRSERQVDWLGREGATGWRVRPADVDQVRDVVRWCASSGTPLVPMGGNTGLVGGTRPDRSAVVLDLTDLTELRFDAVAGVARAQAGVLLARLQEGAAAAGWYYGVDLAARDSATVGGTVATNAGGIRVCAFGSTRAQLLGVQAVLADGELIDDLRALPKDNTGYSLRDLICGSEGTLAIVTEVAVRLHRPPGPSVVVAAVVADLTTAVTTARRLSEPQRLLAAEVVDAAAWRSAAADRGLRDPLRPATGYVLVVELEVGSQDPADVLAGLAEAIPPGPGLAGTDRLT